MYVIHVYDRSGGESNNEVTEKLRTWKSPNVKTAGIL